MAGKPDAPLRLIGAAVRDGRLRLASSTEIDVEYGNLAYRRSIRRYLESRRIDVQTFMNAMASLREHAELVAVTGEPPPCRDPNDRKYLHCVRDGNVPYLITRDRDLLESTAVPTTRILTPEEFVQEFGLG